MKKCSIELPDEFAELAFETRCCRLTATTNSGKTFSAEFRLTPEDDDRGMPKKDLEAKFNSLTRTYLKPATRKGPYSRFYRRCHGSISFGPYSHFSAHGPTQH